MIARLTRHLETLHHRNMLCGRCLHMTRQGLLPAKANAEPGPPSPSASTAGTLTYPADLHSAAGQSGGSVVWIHRMIP